MVENKLPPTLSWFSRTANPVNVIRCCPSRAVIGPHGFDYPVVFNILLDYFSIDANGAHKIASRAYVETQYFLFSFGKSLLKYSAFLPLSIFITSDGECFGGTDI
jgi:hypothetical protein